MSKIITSIVLAVIVSAIASFCAAQPATPEFVTSFNGLVAGGLLGLLIG